MEVIIDSIWDNKNRQWLKIDKITDDLIFTDCDGNQISLKQCVELCGYSELSLLTLEIPELRTDDDKYDFDKYVFIGGKNHEAYYNLSTYDELVNLLTDEIISKLKARETIKSKLKAQETVK